MILEYMFASILSASDAKKISDRNPDTAPYELAIKQAAEEGKYHADVRLRFEYVNPKIKSKLESLGYTVTEDGMACKTYATKREPSQVIWCDWNDVHISWAVPK